MKHKILLFALVLFAFNVNAQRTEPPTGSPSSINRFRGGLIVDSLLQVPKRDTTPFFIYQGDLVRNKHDNKLYYLNENNTYKPVGGEGGGFIHYADTTATIATKSDLKLSYNTGTRMLKIAGGNAVTLPIENYEELTQTITGQTSRVFTLSQDINNSKHLIIVMNATVIDPSDYTVTGTNKITLSFNPKSTDRFIFYFKNTTP